MKFTAEFGLTPAYGRLKDLGALGYLTLDGIEQIGDSAPGGMNTQDWVIYRSNWLAAMEALPEGGVEGEAQFIKEHPGEAYPGDVVYEAGFINIYKGAASVVAKATEMVDDLSNYPVIDEDKMSEIENEALEEELDSWAMGDAERELGYRNDPDQVLTDAEAAWLDGLAQSNPEELARIEKGMELIYQLGPEKEQKLRRAVRDGLTYGDWTVVHIDQVKESLAEQGVPEMADPEATLHQFLANEMQAATPGSAADMQKKEAAGQQRLFESLRLASNVVGGKLEVKRLVAATEATTKAKSVANMVAKIIGVDPSTEVAGGGLIAYKVRKQLMAALFKAHADGSFSVSWAPMRLFASADAAGRALAGHTMLSFDTTTKLRVISDALIQFKAAGTRWGVWNNYDEMPAFPEAFANEAEARGAAESLKERFKTQGFYKTSGGFKVPFDVLTVATHAENPDASFMIVPETDNPEMFAEMWGEAGAFEASKKRPTLMGRLRTKSGAGTSDDIGPASLKARNWARLQGYKEHAGTNLLCVASKSRMRLWAKTPKGFEPVVKELKKKGDVENPWAVAWSMKNKGIKPKASRKVKASTMDHYKVSYKGKEYEIVDEQRAEPEVGIPSGYLVFVPEGAPEEGYTIDMPQDPDDTLNVYDEKGNKVGTGFLVRAGIEDDRPEEEKARSRYENMSTEDLAHKLQMNDRNGVFVSFLDDLKSGEESLGTGSLEADLKQFHGELVDIAMDNWREMKDWERHALMVNSSKEDAYDVDKEGAIVDALKAEGFMGIELEYPGFIALYDVPGMPKNYFLLATPWFNSPDELDFNLNDPTQDVIGSEEQALASVPFPPKDALLADQVEAFKRILTEKVPAIVEVAKADAAAHPDKKVYGKKARIAAAKLKIKAGEKAVVFDYSASEQGRDRDETEGEWGLQFYSEDELTPELIERFKKAMPEDLVWDGDDKTPGYSSFDYPEDVDQWVMDMAEKLASALRAEFGADNVEVEEAYEGGTITVVVS